MVAEPVHSIISGRLIADHLVWGRAYTVRPARADVADQSIRELERNGGLPAFALRELSRDADAPSGLQAPLAESFRRPPLPGPVIDTPGWHCGLSEADALQRTRARWQRFADSAGGIAPVTALYLWSSAIRGRFIDLSLCDNLLADEHVAALHDGAIDGVTYTIQGIAAKFALVLRPDCISSVRLVRRIAADAIAVQGKADSEMEIFNLFLDEAG